MKLTKQTLITLSLMLCFALLARAQSDIAKVRLAMQSGKIFKSKIVIGQNNHKPMKILLQSISDDGSFNRADKSPQADDFKVILEIGKVFCHKDSVQYYQAPEVKDKLYRSLEHWLKTYAGYQWIITSWDQTNQLGTILLLLHDNMKADADNVTYSTILQNIKARALAFIRHSWNHGNGNLTTFGRTGTTLTDEQHRTANIGYRLYGYTAIAAALDDSVSVADFRPIIDNQFPYIINRRGDTDHSGNLYDGSLFQHGSQTYNVGYGNEWLRDVGYYAEYVNNTVWKFPEEYAEIYGSHLNDGMRWATYKKNNYLNIMGRNNQKIGPSIYDLRADIDHYLAIVQPSYPLFPVLSKLRKNLDDAEFTSDSSKYLWNSHLIIQDRPKYGVSIKMLSNRIKGGETGTASSDQGRQNFHIGDGSTMIYRRKGEYDLVRVGWDWRCVPGITTKQRTGTLPLVPWGEYYYSNNRIAGGVSDGNVSIGAFKLDRKGPQTKALKSYFSFDDAIICIGNSVSDTTTVAGDVYTTINQTERRTDTHFMVNNEAEKIIPLSSNEITNLDIRSASWFWQDSIGYIVLPKDKVETSLIMTTSTRRANWLRLDGRNPDSVETANIFQLSINHGITGAGKDDSYRYIVVPSVSKSGLIDFFNKRVLATDPSSLYINYNNADVISVSYKGYTGIFFTQENKIKATKLGADSLSISSNKPVAVLLKRNANGLIFNVSDLGNAFVSSNVINLGINRVLKEASFDPLRASGPTKIIPYSDSTLVQVNTAKKLFIHEGEPVQFQVENLYQPTEVTLNAIGDSYAESGPSANTNFGLEPRLVVKRGISSYWRESYVKFDLRNMRKGAISNAKLALYASTAVVTKWDLFRAGNQWTETGITWNNKPSATTAVIGSVQGAQAAGYVYWDINSLLQNLGADSIVTFKIVTPVNYDNIYSSFHSLQTVNPPKIVYTLDERIVPVVKLLAAVAPKLNTTELSKPLETEANYEKLAITNALSPNGDGINDTWNVQDIDQYPNNLVRIVNRSGTVVYEKNGYDNSWDGYFNGAPLPEGTYYYIIDFGSNNGIRKGFISLVK